MAENAAMFSAGPPLVQAALGIEATPTELGGALLHTRDSGVAHNLGKTEQDCIAMARYFLSLLPPHSGETLPEQRAHPSAERRAPIRRLTPGFLPIFAVFLRNCRRPKSGATKPAGFRSMSKAGVVRPVRATV